MSKAKDLKHGMIYRPYDVIRESLEYNDLVYHIHYHEYGGIDIDVFPRKLAAFFLAWLCCQPVTDDPAGDFVQETLDTFRVENGKTIKIKNKDVDETLDRLSQRGCAEAKKQYLLWAVKWIDHNRIKWLERS